VPKSFCQKLQAQIVST